MKRSTKNGGKPKRSRVATSNTSGPLRNNKRPDSNQAKVPRILPIVDFGFGFPRKAKIVHRYSDTYSMSSTSGAVVRYRYSCNGLYDPDKNIGGHQPLYFDQMTNLYNHYTVIGSKMTIKFVPVVGNTVPVNVSIIQDDDQTTLLNSMSEVREQSTSISTLIPVSGAATAKEMTVKWSGRATFGDSSKNSNMRGSASANPLENTEWNVFLQAADRGSTVTLYAQIDIEYITIWDELKEQTGS